MSIILPYTVNPCPNTTIYLAFLWVKLYTVRVILVWDRVAFRKLFAGLILLIF